MLKATTKKLATIATGVSMVALMAMSASAMTWQDADKADENKSNRIIVKEKSDGKSNIFIKRTEKDGKASIDVKGGEIIEMSDDGKSFTIQGEDGETHVITLHEDDEDTFMMDDEGNMSKHRIIMMDDADKDSKRFNEEKMMWKSKGKKPNVWVSNFDVRGPEMMGMPGGRGLMKAHEEIDDAMADIQKELDSLEDKKRNRPARAALQSALESLESVKEELSHKGPKPMVFKMRKNGHKMTKEEREAFRKDMKKMREDIKSSMKDIEKEMSEDFSELSKELSEMKTWNPEDFNFDFESDENFLSEKERAAFLESVKQAEKEIARAKEEIAKAQEEVYKSFKENNTKETGQTI